MDDNVDKIKKYIKYRSIQDQVSEATAATTSLKKLDSIDTYISVALIKAYPGIQGDITLLKLGFLPVLVSASDGEVVFFIINSSNQQEFDSKITKLVRNSGNSALIKSSKVTVQVDVANEILTFRSLNLNFSKENLSLLFEKLGENNAKTISVGDFSRITSWVVKKNIF